MTRDIFQDVPEMLPMRMPAAPAKLRVLGVSRRFEEKSGVVSALDNISMEVGQGEFLCIVGPSGCGKSTLLNLMAGLDLPSSGEIWLDGRPTDAARDNKLSVIFQELGLFPWLTVLDNVAFGLKMRNVERAERIERAREALKLVHLSRFEKHFIHQLSGGMRQRVALARSLVLRPDVLFMDEPFAALDAQTRDLMHEELERIWRETGQTIVFVTHNVREAIRLGDRVLLLTFRPGRVKTEFPIGLPRPRHMEDPRLALAARDVLAQLKEEINKAVDEEYGDAASR